MGLIPPVGRRIHAGGGESALDAQLVLAGLDVVGHGLQAVEAGDVVLGVAGSGEQLLVVNDAVRLDDVGDGGDGVAVLQREGIAGQLAVQLGVGQVQAVVLPVGQAHRAVDLEQGGGLALFHLAHQGGLVLVGGGGHDGDGHAGLGGVLGGQVLPGFVLLGLEVQVVDLAGSGGRGAAGRASSRAGGGGGSSRRAAGRTTGGQNTGSGHRTGGLQEVAAGNHVFHSSSPLFVLGLSRVYAARPGGTGKRQSYKSAAPLGGRTLSPSWREGASTTVWAGAPCSIWRSSNSTQRVASSSVGWTIDARAGTQ